LSLAAGEVYWAIVPSTPATPFKIHVADGTPVEVPTTFQIVDGLRKGGDAEFEFVVYAKARPMPLLSGLSCSEMKTFRLDPTVDDRSTAVVEEVDKLLREGKQVVVTVADETKRYEDLGDGRIHRPADVRAVISRYRPRRKRDRNFAVAGNFERIDHDSRPISEILDDADGPHG
jgi:hypothetical protein